jgi:hypothetical protein
MELSDEHIRYKITMSFFRSVTSEEHNISTFISEDGDSIVKYRVFYSRWKFISIPKLSTLQLNTISHSPNTRRASTLSDVPHKLTFLQSGTVQAQVRSQPLRSSGTNSHPCNREASRHTRTIHRPL